MQLKRQNNNTDLAQSTHRIKKIMQSVLSQALKEGATDASVAVNHEQGYSVDVRMGEVETVAFGEDKGITLTVYHGHRKGNASTTDTSEKALDMLVKAACDIAKSSSEDVCFGLADKFLLTNEYSDLNLYHDWDLQPKQAIERALACEAKALAVDKRISNSDGVSISTSNSHIGYANTNGAEGVVHTTSHGMSASLIARNGEEMQRDYEFCNSRKPEELMSIEELAEKVSQRTLSRLGARKIKTRKAPVMFSPRVSSSLFSTFISAVSGSNLYRKSSFLVDSIGKEIFPEYIHIYEQPHIQAGLGSFPFDGEGVPTRNNEFVKQGAINQYVLGSYAARRLGLQTTANSDGVHNLTIDPTTNSFDDVLKEMGTGLLVTDLMGQGVNLLTGDYSRGARGYWVENGEIQFPVEEITIAGNLKQIYQHIIAVGADINPNISTRCGSVLIEQMMIAGE